MLTASIFRPHRCDVWRKTETLNGDGTRGVPTWERKYTNVPYRSQTGESVQAPTGEFIYGEQDNMFSLDLLHFNAGADVQGEDILRQTTGPDAGNYWTVRGDAQQRTQFAGKLSVRASRVADVHPTITGAY